MQKNLVFSFCGLLFGILIGFASAHLGRFLPDRKFSDLIAERNKIYLMWKGADYTSAFAKAAFDAERFGVHIIGFAPRTGIGIVTLPKGDIEVSQSWYFEIDDSSWSSLDKVQRALVEERIKQVVSEFPSTRGFKVDEIQWDEKQKFVRVSWSYRAGRKELEKEDTHLLISRPN